MLYTARLNKIRELFSRKKAIEDYVDRHEDSSVMYNDLKVEYLKIIEELLSLI